MQEKEEHATDLLRMWSSPHGSSLPPYCSSSLVSTASTSSIILEEDHADDNSNNILGRTPRTATVTRSNKGSISTSSSTLLEEKDYSSTTFLVGKKKKGDTCTDSNPHTVPPPTAAASRNSSCPPLRNTNSIVSQHIDHSCYSVLSSLELEEQRQEASNIKMEKLDVTNENDYYYSNGPCWQHNIIIHPAEGQDWWQRPPTRRRSASAALLVEEEQELLETSHDGLVLSYSTSTGDFGCLAKKPKHHQQCCTTCHCSSFCRDQIGGVFIGISSSTSATRLLVHQL